MIFNISNQLRFFGTLIVALTFAFLINNFFNFWGNWPGVDTFFANKGLFGLKELKDPLKGSLAIKAWIQFLSYIFVIFLCFFYIAITSDKKLNDEADLFAKLSAYIIRSSFWLVFLQGQHLQCYHS